MRIEPFHAEFRHDFRRQSQTIGTDDFAIRLVPQKEMMVIRIENIGVRFAPRSLAGRAERNFAKTPQLA